MIEEDEDALFCDFAETYHILNFYSLQVETAARLAAGLRENSRIKSKMAGLEASFNTFILADAADSLRLLLWTKTKDATKGRNRPKRITDSLIHKDKDPEIVSTSTPAEFEAIRAKILGVGNG